MSGVASEAWQDAKPPARSRGGMARRFVLAAASLIALSLGLNAAIGAYFAFSDQRALVARVQHEQAQAAAQRIAAFIGDIVRQLDWASQAGTGPNPSEEARLDNLRLMRQVPAILELRQVALDGTERLALSRFDRDRVDSGVDWSGDAAFEGAFTHPVFYGEVTFRRGSEPFMRLAKRTASGFGGVVMATVNLTFIKDLVSAIKVGDQGRAYVVTRSGRLIAHPDLRFVLRNTSLAGLLAAHGEAGRAGPGDPARAIAAIDIEERQVLSVLATAPELDWSVVVDLPLREAFAPIYASLLRSLAVFLAALAAAVAASIVLSRRLVEPVQALREGATRIGEGRLDQRIAISTGDELQELGEQFNLMAERLGESRAALEDKVAARTADLARALEQASAGRKAAEEARRAAEEATLAKSRFLAVVGHDIRTPLSGVLGVLEILDRKRLTQRDRRLIEMAAASGETLIALANATLDLSRLEAGTEPLELRDYAPAPLLEAAAALLRPAAARKDLTLTLDLGPIAGLRLHGDPGKINRIVFNLLSNAVAFTDAGEISLSARHDAAGEGAPRLTITVRDTGIGIEPAMQRRVFDDFVQVDPETGRRTGGVGLGLSICRKLAVLLGGAVTLESRPGAGSVFTVTLPAPPALALAPAQGEPAIEAALVVLVIDDEPITRDVARIMIAKAGHKALGAASGEEALSLLGRTRVDAVVLDMHMGGMDGIETASAIRAMTGIAQPEIIALTADVSPETMRRLRKAGLTAILSKPATSAALRQALTRGRGRSRRVAAISLRADRPLDERFLGEQRRLVGPAMMERLVALFSSVSAEQVAALRAGLERGDRPAIERAAHQFASSASALGLGQAVTAAAVLEAAAATAEPEALARAIADLAARRDEAVAALADEADDASPQALRSAKMPSL